MVFTWNPNNNAQSTSQTIQWRDVAVGTWRTDLVTPSNDLSDAAITANLTGLYPNALFEVRVRANCANNVVQYSASTYYYIYGALIFNNGITNTGGVVQLGGDAVSGTGDTTSPFTKHRDFTGAFRLSFKNDRTLFGSDNEQDDTTTRLKTVGKGYTSGTNNFIATTGITGLGSGNIKYRPNITSKDDGNIFLGTIQDSGNWLNFLTIDPNNKVFEFESRVGPVYIKNGGKPIHFKEDYACFNDKYVFESRPTIAPSGTTPVAGIKLYTEMSGLTNNTTSVDYYALQLQAVSSDWNNTAKPKIDFVRIDGAINMPISYATGEVTFFKVVPTYDRMSIGLNVPTGVSLLRGFYYAPSIQSDAVNMQQEIAFQSTRGIVKFTNGSGLDTLQLPSLTTTQRDNVIPLTTISETVNTAKVIYNETNKAIEYNIGAASQWVTTFPVTLTAGLLVNWFTYKLNATISLTTNTTIVLSADNLIPGNVFTLVATQDATGRTLSTSAAGFTVKSAGTLGGANTVNLITYYVASASLILETIAQPYV